MERAGILAGVRVRLLETDECFSLRGETLKLAMEEDRAKGFIPFFVRNFGYNSFLRFRRPLRDWYRLSTVSKHLAAR